MNIAQLLQRSAQVHGDCPALASGRRITASYAQFWERASRLAATLREQHGVGPGERVGLYCPNHPDYLEAMYAVFITGAAIVPINSKLHPREVQWLLEDSQARACWTDRAGLDGLRAVAPQGMAVLDLDDIESMRAAQTLPMEPRENDDLAWLFYTSGTTGRPKGAMLSHGNLLHATQCFLADVHPVQVGEMLMHAAPQSHGSGLYNFAYIARAGINGVPESRGFDEDEVLDLATHYPGMSLFAAPTMVKRLVEAERSRPGRARNLGTVVYGGGPMYLADIQDAIAVIGQKFAQIYGQGETPMTISTLPQHLLADVKHPRYLQRLASVGHVQLCVELSIRGADGQPLPAGEIGEICVRGPTVMQGYWNKPEATRDAIRDGWLWTGDVGVLDEDGFLTLKDRSKDMIISGGTNIYPREVEETLLEHPQVREVSVIGVPDPEWGESVLAYVVMRDPHESIEPQTLDAFCIERIARFKRPKFYRFVPELPKNNYGKVLKTELRAWAKKDPSLPRG